MKYVSVSEYLETSYKDAHSALLDITLGYRKASTMKGLYHSASLCIVLVCVIVEKGFGMDSQVPVETGYGKGFGIDSQVPVETRYGQDLHEQEVKTIRSYRSRSRRSIYPLLLLSRTEVPTFILGLPGSAQSSKQKFAQKFHLPASVQKQNMLRDLSDISPVQMDDEKQQDEFHNVGSTSEFTVLDFAEEPQSVAREMSSHVPKQTPLRLENNNNNIPVPEVKPNRELMEMKIKRIIPFRVTVALVPPSKEEAAVVYVPLEAHMSVLDALVAATIWYRDNHSIDNDNNPFNILLDWDENSQCYIPVRAREIRNRRRYAWTFIVTNGQNEVIYESQCLPDDSVILRPFSSVTVSYERSRRSPRLVLA